MENIETTENRILKAALKLFSEKGFAATTTSEVAKEAEVAEGTIFRYFPRKTDLMKAVVILSIEKFGESVAIKPLRDILEDSEGKTLHTIFKEMATQRLELAEKHKDLIKIIWHEMAFNQEINSAIKNHIGRKARAMLMDFFEELKRQGKVKQIPSYLAMRAFVFMIIGLFVERVHSSFMKEETSISKEEELDYIIGIFLNGVAVEEEEAKA